MAQFADPIADLVTDAQWTSTPYWSKLDEGAPGDDVYISTSSSGVADIVGLDLGTVTDPEVSTDHIIRIRHGKTSAHTQVNRTTIELRQGYVDEGTLGTLIASTFFDTSMTDSSLVTNTYTLSGTEADNITDYSDLQIRTWTARDNDAAGRPHRIDYIQLEVPDASGGLNAPGSPSATPNSTSQITIDWTDTNTSETGYRVDRSPAGEGSWSDVSGNLAANTEQYVDTGLDPGTSYDYRIFAFDGSGDGPGSTTVTARTTSEQIGSLPLAAVIGQWDARDLPGSDNDAVDSWADVGPDAQDPLAQATSSKQPVLDDSDSLRWVLFDGSDDLLANTLDQTYTGDFAIIAVVEPLTYPTGSASVLYSTGFLNGVTEKNILGIDDVEAGWPNGAWVVMSGDGTQGEHYHGTDLTLDAEIPGRRLVMTQLVRNAGEQKVWEDSVLVIDEADAGNGDNLNDMPGMFLGCREDETRHMHARVGILLLVDMSQATEAQLLSARDDLMAAYGLADLVGLTHLDASATFHTIHVSGANELDHLDASATFHTMTVEAGLSGQLDLDHADLSATFHQPDLVGIVQLDHLDASATFHEPQIDAVIVLGHFQNTQFHEPIVAQVAIDLDHLDASATFHEPSIGAFIDLDHLDASATFHTMTVGSSSIDLDHLSNTTFHNGAVVPPGTVIAGGSDLLLRGVK